MIQTPVFLSIEEHILMPEQLKNNHERAGPSTSRDYSLILGPLPGTAVQSIFRLPCFPFWALVLAPGSVRGTYCLRMTRVVPYPGLPSVEYGLVPKSEFFSHLFTSPQNSIKVKTRGGRTEAEAKTQSPDESAWADSESLSKK